MPRIFTTLIAYFGLEDRLTSDSMKRSARQCLLASAVVLLLLLILDTVTQTVLIAALGSSAFIAFAVPRSKVSRPRCLIGGYVIGILAGTSMGLLNEAIDLSTVLNPHVGMIVFGALATGMAMFLMVITRTEHPPASALALGLVLNEWTGVTLLVVISGVVILSVCKQLVMPHLMDLA